MLIVMVGMLVLSVPGAAMAKESSPDELDGAAQACREAQLQCRWIQQGDRLMEKIIWV